MYMNICFYNIFIVLAILHAECASVHFRGGRSVTLYCNTNITTGYGIKWFIQTINGTNVTSMFCIHNARVQECGTHHTTNMRIKCSCIYGSSMVMRVDMNEPWPGIHVCVFYGTSVIINETVLMPETYVNARYNGWYNRQIACGLHYDLLDMYESTLSVQLTKINSLQRCKVGGVSFDVYEDIGYHTNNTVAMYTCSVIVRSPHLEYYDQTEVFFNHRLAGLETYSDEDGVVTMLRYAYDGHCIYCVTVDLAPCIYVYGNYCQTKWPMPRCYDTTRGDTYEAVTHRRGYHDGVSFIVLANKCSSGTTRVDLYVSPDGDRGLYSIYFLDEGSMHVVSVYAPHKLSMYFDSHENIMTCTIDKSNEAVSQFVYRPQCEGLNETVNGGTYTVGVMANTRYTCTVRDKGCAFGTSVYMYSNGSFGEPFMEDTDPITHNCVDVAYFESSTSCIFGNMMLFVICMLISLYIWY